jgi:hypothetical protein
VYLARLILFKLVLSALAAARAAHVGRGGDREAVRGRPSVSETAKRIIRLELPRPTIFRVDHFLPDDLFASDRPSIPQPGVQPIWNSVHVSAWISAGWKA